MAVCKKMYAIQFYDRRFFAIKTPIWLIGFLVKLALLSILLCIDGFLSEILSINERRKGYDEFYSLFLFTSTFYSELRG